MTTWVTWTVTTRLWFFFYYKKIK